MHWAVEPEVIRPLIPKRLELDVFDGKAWLGVVPFRMSGVAPIWSPDLPGLSAFPELNVQTYVRDPIDEAHGGKPGVWFFSLDATNRIAVRGARWLFHLNYVDANIRLTRQTENGDEWIRYSSRRRQTSLQAELETGYRPVGGVLNALSDLETWLTSRYCMYTANRSGKILRGEIDHSPWPLQQAECRIERNTMTDWLGFPLPDQPPLLHFSLSIDVHAWSMDRIDDG
jgi:uncharacterized protein YqjF (DUF2071 family)